MLLLLLCIPKHNRFISPALPTTVLYGGVLSLPDLGPYSIEELISVNLVCVPSSCAQPIQHSSQRHHSTYIATFTSKSLNGFPEPTELLPVSIPLSPFPL